MTGGNIVDIQNHECLLALQIMDDEGAECLTKISGTNYKLKVGDYISWNKEHAFWRSQHKPEKEVILFFQSSSPIAKKKQ